ncbi:hypothetical protein HY839_04690 [Candidatus Azambacteria bacterium]|nr:hypothetical protein [Candidatus Azambacteria bacterium]
MSMYNVVPTFPEVVGQSVDFVWTSLVIYTPRLFLAVLLFVVFLLIGATLYAVVSRFVTSLKVDALLAKGGIDIAFQRAGMTLHTGHFLGALVKWFFILTGLLIASNLLGLTQVADFLTQILYYIPSIVVAAIILVAGALIADLASKVTTSSMAASGLHTGAFAGKVVKWAVFIFALGVALDQLGVAQTFINTLYIGIVAMIAIAGGLAFGLGGKEHASELITKIKRDISQ